MAAFVSVDIIILDYISSPYQSTIPGLIGWLFLVAYSLNIFGTIMLATLFLFRIKIFHGASSSFYKTMVGFAVIVIFVKAAGDFIGIYVTYSFATGKYESPLKHPLYKTIPLVLAIGTALEGIFSAAGSVSFIYYLTDFKDRRDWNALREKVLQTEGARLTLIICVHAVIVYLGICVVIDDNYVSHTGFFLPALAYALELSTFLDLSFNSARKILSAAQSAVTTVDSIIK
jgi:hypothetical protein